MAPAVAGTIWKENVKIADENNHPGKFTAFCSYEWTSALTIATCTAMSSSGLRTRCRKCRIALWTPITPKTLEVDGHTAEGRQRVARHFAQR